MRLHALVLVAYIAGLATVGVASYLHPSYAGVLLVIWIILAVCGITATGLWLTLRDRPAPVEDAPAIVPRSINEVTSAASADLYITEMVRDSEWLPLFRRVCSDYALSNESPELRRGCWLLMCAIDRRTAREEAMA